MTTTKTTTRVNSVQHDFGRTRGWAMGTLPTGISGIINSTEQVTTLYGELETDKERKAFFDEFLKRQRNGFGEAWMCIYQTVDLIRTNDWYWKDSGFDSFEAFWQTQGQALFGKWAELENLYHYARQAAPELFEVDLSEAKTKAQIDLMRAKLSLIQPAAKHGGKRAGAGRPANNQDTHANLELDPKQQAALNLLGPGNQSADYQAGWAAGRSDKARGGNSMTKRFERLRRDHPEIADRMLAGEDKFFPVDKHGQVRVDMVAAEIEAGIRKEGEKTRQPADPMAQISKYLTKLDTKQLKKLHTLTAQLLESRK